MPLKRISVLLISLILLSKPVYSSDTHESGSPAIINFLSDTDKSKITKFSANLENILSELQKIRKISLKSPVYVGVKNSEELNQFLNQSFDDEISESELDSELSLLSHLGLIKKDYDFKNEFLNLYTEQIAGFYDNKSRTLYLIENSSLGPVEFSLIISHELVHALQDQNFDLTKIISTKESSDKSMAIKAFIEGEATVVSMEQFLRKINSGFSELPDLASIWENPVLRSLQPSYDNVPGFIVEEMLFPYTEGSKFVQNIYNYYDNWNDFSSTYQQLPVSTEQILHPDKYLAGEMPVEINLDENDYKSDKWHFINKDTLGEFFFFNYFLEYTGESNARKAADGWAGDKVLLYKNEKRIMMLLKTSWDTEDDAKDFFRNYISSLNLRYAKDIKSISNDNKFWAETSSGKIYIVLNNKSVNISEGFDSDNEKEIRKLTRIN